MLAVGRVVAAKGYPGFPAALGKVSSLSKSRRLGADSVHATMEFLGKIYQNIGNRTILSDIFRANHEIWVKLCQNHPPNLTGIVHTEKITSFVVPPSLDPKSFSRNPWRRLLMELQAGF